MKQNNLFCSFYSAAVSVCAALAVMLSMASCRTDDDVISEMSSSSEKATVLTAEQGEALMNQLCTTSTDARGQTFYSPLIGQALEPAKPTVYYCIANDAQQAEARYRSILESLADAPGPAVDGRNIFAGDIHLTFAEGAGTDETGRITVESRRLKNVLTQIVFIPEARWPANDAASQINYLSVWRNKKSNLLYVCVKPANPDAGYMVCLEETKPAKDFPMATDAAINALGMTLIDYPEYCEEMVDYIKEHIEERDGSFNHFTGFQRLVYKAGTASYETGEKVADIAKRDGHSEYFYAQMPKHKSGTPANSIYASSITIYRDTKLNANEWECVKY